MTPQIKLTVTQNDKIIKTVSKTIEQQYLVKSLEEFQVEANAALTKMIEELGEIDEAIGDGDGDSDEDVDEDSDSNVESSKAADEESNGHSESKKKKHH